MKKRVWLRQLRVSHGLTQETVATRSYIDRSFYAQIENGTRDPSMIVASNISKVLGVHPDIFFAEHLHASYGELSKPTGNVTYAQSDLDLKYTWIWSPRCDTKRYLGMRDVDIDQNEGMREISYLKKQVILQGVALEKIVFIPRHGALHAYLVRGEPLFNEDERIVGVYTIITSMPGLLLSDQRIDSLDTRGILQGHILYFFESRNAYLSNLITYVSDAVKFGYHVWIVDAPDVCKRIDALVRQISPQGQSPCVHFIDSEKVYGTDNLICADCIHEYFIQYFSLIFQQGTPVRIWTRVPWNRNAGHSVEKTNLWASKMDDILSKVGITSVCAYDSTNVPAVLLSNLMRTHEFLMTDGELVYSPLYSKQTED